MAIFRTKKEDLRELGFGSRNYKERVRFLTPQGVVNVQRAGLGKYNNTDLYHYLTTVSSGKLSLFILIGYIAINLIFGGIYYIIGPENFEGVNHGSEFQKFLSLFFFSAQTITTLGYGHLYPVSNGASIAAAVESLMGLLSFAIATGLIFGRFSRPKAHILYSKNILVAPYDEITGLMFRITNTKQYELIEAETVVNMTITNPETNKREFYNLELEINRISFLSLSWTIVHPINDKSPLYGLSIADLETRDVEILILVKAISDTFGQTVYSRTSYKSEQMIENAKFVPVIPVPTPKGKLVIKVTDIHQYQNL